MLPGEANFSAGEETATLLIGAVVFALIALGFLAAVIWKSAWKQSRRHVTPEGLDHAAIARHLLLVGLTTIFVFGPILMLGVIVAGGILTGLATVLGASLPLGTLIAAAILLAGAAAWLHRDFEQFLSDNADYISPRRVRAIDREMEARLRAAPHPDGRTPSERSPEDSL